MFQLGQVIPGYTVASGELHTQADRQLHVKMCLAGLSCASAQSQFLPELCSRQQICRVPDFAEKRC